MEDNLFMSRCIELAKLAGGYNRPNPEVGSLIVCEGLIIGEGWHEKYGQAHAEVNAINAVKDKSLLSKSTIYVTLEPCFHFGKTPPCVDLILKHKIPRVVIGCRDPYHEVAGKSIEKLKNAGVEVVVGVLEQEVEWLNRRFFTNVRKHRLYIVLKYAVSKDAYIAKAGTNMQISKPLAKNWVHKLRTEEDAIMVGRTTALIDNPQLNVRHFFGPQPIRIVLDKQLSLPENLHLFDGKQTTLVFTEVSKKSDHNNLEYIQIDFSDKHFIKNMLSELYKKKIVSVLIEGGAILLNSFLDSGLWDEAYILRSRNLLLDEGLSAPYINPAFLSECTDFHNDIIEQYLNPNS